MEIKFLPWMAAGNKGNEASERILRGYFKQLWGEKAVKNAFGQHGLFILLPLFPALVRPIV